MTCIAGYLHDGGVTLVADTLASTGHLSVNCVPHKLFPAGAALLGVSGGVRLGQTLRYRCPGVTLDSDGPLPSLLRWIEAVRPVLRESGTLRSKEGVEEFTESRMLVALAGRLFEVDSEWQVVEPDTRFWAIGSGQAYALAALDVLDRIQSPLSPDMRLHAAMLTAAKLDPYVQPPFEWLRGEADSVICCTGGDDHAL